MAANSKEWEGICVVRQPSNVRAIMDLLCWWDTHLFYIHYFLRPFLLFARLSTQILDTSKDKKIVLLNWFIQYLVRQAEFFNTSTLSQVLAVFRKPIYLIMFYDLEMALVVYTSWYRLYSSCRFILTLQKWPFRPAFGVCSTQTLVKIYNSKVNE